MVDYEFGLSEHLDGDTFFSYTYRILVRKARLDLCLALDGWLVH